ncbi:hypothetical protein ACIPK5_33585 [Streptomyces sp. NPDC086843]|uniref:hypothetical protein n=1 Tax=unclassified Streptomyces TaxID=2593676 RepID=UPI00382EFAD8
MVETLTSLLPPGSVSGATGTGITAASAGPSAQLTFSNDRGTSIIEVSVGRSPRTGTPEPKCPLRSARPYDRCEDRVVDGVGTLILDQGYTDHLDQRSGARWGVLLATPDGEQVAVIQTEAPTTSGGAVTGGMPLTLDQLADIVTSESWKPVTAAVPEPPEPPAPPAESRFTKGQILDRVKAALDPRLTVADEEGDERGYADLTVDDGKGKSLLTITVQQWKPDSAEMSQLFREATRLPGGVRLVVRENRDDDSGLTQREADALHPDGRRVLVTGINSLAIGTPPTRDNPVLSVDQLKDLALDRAWSSGSVQ